MSVTRYWKAGTIDYKKVPELSGVGLGAVSRTAAARRCASPLRSKRDYGAVACAPSDVAVRGTLMGHSPKTCTTTWQSTTTHAIFQRADFLWLCVVLVARLPSRD